ncbi:MAG: hypothetical protein BWK76_16135 [Desulfobulbaceae bacterium A2]|nr:MAG: hypothetical protein BWK76_16135 [Desulfobulbaceae bacterium A2]
MRLTDGRVLQVVRRDLAAWLYEVDSVMDLDPLAVSSQLNQRSATINGRRVWPDKAMLEAVVGL